MAQRAPGPRRLGRCSTLATGVSAHARAVRAGGGRRGGAPDRAPRALLGPGAGADRHALKRRLKLLFDGGHRPRRLPPPAGCAPRARQQRAAGARPRSGGARAVRRPSGTSRSASSRTGPVTAYRSRSSGLACARHCKGPLRVDAGPARVRAWGIVTGAGADYLGGGGCARSRRVHHGRARRAHDGVPASRGSTSSPPDTMRRRPSA